MFLWQNDKTVFIGKNQNCWAECHVSRLEADGGKLARRLSGGGAVFHDIQNLNFTFSVNRNDYNVAKQLSVIADAVKSYGIEAVLSGRNDILADGCKFSGNAFYCSGENFFHHGTILIKTDTEKMARYLNVPQDKLSAKGIASVRSRVINLSVLNDSITVNGMKEKLVTSFGNIYGLPLSEYEFPAYTKAEIEGYVSEFASPEWKYDKTPRFTHSFGKRFSWGGITFCLEVKGGKIEDCAVYSDSLDPIFISSIPTWLKDRRYDAADLTAALAVFGERQETADIAQLFSEEI
jgi:lipoate-protein ligase A